MGAKVIFLFISKFQQGLTYSALRQHYILHFWSGCVTNADRGVLLLRNKLGAGPARDPACLLTALRLPYMRAHSF